MKRFLETRYVRGGRDGDELDCYGLVRQARSALFGRPLMPRCDSAQPRDFSAITCAVDAIAGAMKMRPGRALPGAVATAWSGSLCVHVGLVVEVDGRRMVLETDVPTGPILTQLKSFSMRYARVVYYDD